MAKKGRIPEAAAKAAAGRLRGTLSYDSFDGVDLVIEAAIEVSHCSATVSSEWHTRACCALRSAKLQIHILWCAPQAETLMIRQHGRQHDHSPGV